jgi:hypothetical protein
VAIPLVLSPSGELLAIVTDDGTGHSWLNEKGLQLKQRVFSLESGNTTSYGDLSQLFNKQGTGILQQIQPVEGEVIARGEEAIAQLRKNSKNIKTIESYYDWVDDYVVEQYRELFSIE